MVNNNNNDDDNNNNNNNKAQEIKNVESKADTYTTGYPISNRISTIHSYTTVKHNGNRTSNQRYTKSCHIRHTPYN
jgi:hypothetical protein